MMDKVQDNMLGPLCETSMIVACHIISQIKMLLGNKNTNKSESESYLVYLLYPLCLCIILK